MSGYLHFTREREDSPAGRILGLLHEAGNAYHNTKFWTETNEWTQKSYSQQIEEMVCRECDALTAERDKWKACARSHDITNPPEPVLGFLAKQRRADSALDSKDANK